MNNGNGLVDLDGGHKCLTIVSSHSFRAVQFSIEALAVQQAHSYSPQVSGRGVE